MGNGDVIVLGGVIATTLLLGVCGLVAMTQLGTSAAKKSATSQVPPTPLDRGQLSQPPREPASVSTKEIPTLPPPQRESTSGERRLLQVAPPKAVKRPQTPHMEPTPVSNKKIRPLQPSLPPLSPRQFTPPPQFPLEPTDGTGSESDNRFLTLPPEMHDRIAYFLPPDKVRELRLVNRALDKHFRDDMHSFKIKSSQDLHTLINERRFSIEQLDLSEFRDLNDVDCEQIAKLTNLKYLKITLSDGLTYAGFECLKALNELQHLDIRGWPGVDDAELAHLKALTNLRYLSITLWNGVTHAGECLKVLTNLRYLNINLCDGVTDEVLEHIKALTKLQELHVWGCWLTDASFEHIKALPDLRRLDIGYSGVTDEGIAKFRRERPQCEVWGR
jgi:hypothetical protein